MANLTEVIKENLGVLKCAFKGAVRGIYTPALLSTGITQFNNECNNETLEESIGSGVAQILTTAASISLINTYAFEKGIVKEYIGALVVTNLVDYLIHAYNRSKK